MLISLVGMDKPSGLTYVFIGLPSFLTLFLCRSFDRKTGRPAEGEHAVPPFENWRSEGENWALQKPGELEVPGFRKRLSHF